MNEWSDPTTVPLNILAYVQRLADSHQLSLLLSNGKKWMKKHSEETQTLRAGCSKAEPKKFAPRQTPFPEARDGPNLISWRSSLPLPANPVWWGSMHAISSYCGNRPTTHTHTPTDRTEWLITIHCAAASAKCKKKQKRPVEHDRYEQ